MVTEGKLLNESPGYFAPVGPEPGRQGREERKVAAVSREPGVRPPLRCKKRRLEGHGTPSLWEPERSSGLPGGRTLHAAKLGGFGAPGAAEARVFGPGAEWKLGRGHLGFCEHELQQGHPEEDESSAQGWVLVKGFLCKLIYST